MLIFSILDSIKLKFILYKASQNDIDVNFNLLKIKSDFIFFNLKLQSKSLHIFLHFLILFLLVYFEILLFHLFNFFL